MKNLKLSTSVSVGIDLQSEDESLLCSAFDVERNRVFFASSANVVYGLQLSSSQVRKSKLHRNCILIDCRLNYIRKIMVNYPNLASFSSIRIELTINSLCDIFFSLSAHLLKL